MLEMKKLKLLITIVERGKGQKVAEFLKTRQIPISHHLFRAWYRQLRSFKLSRPG